MRVLLYYCITTDVPMSLHSGAGETTAVLLYYSNTTAVTISLYYYWCAHFSTQCGRWEYCCITVILQMCPCLYTVGQVSLMLFYCTTVLHLLCLSLNSGAGKTIAVLLYYNASSALLFYCNTVILLLCPCLFTYGQVRVSPWDYCCTTVLLLMCPCLYTVGQVSATCLL